GEPHPWEQRLWRSEMRLGRSPGRGDAVVTARRTMRLPFLGTMVRNGNAEIGREGLSIPCKVSHQRSTRATPSSWMNDLKCFSCERLMSLSKGSPTSKF